MSGSGSGIRIVAIGDGSVGKTCLLTVFKGDPFPEDYEPTIFENYNERHTYNGKEYQLHLWDTAGQEEYDRMRPMSYNNADVVLVCFSLSSKISLQNVNAKWVPEVNEYCPNASMILVGTKFDIWNQKEVPQSDIDDTLTKTKAFQFISCSAKIGKNVSGVFDLAIESFIAKHKSSDGGCIKN